MEEKPENNLIAAMMYRNPAHFATVVACLSAIIIAFIMMIFFIAKSKKQNKNLEAALGAKSEFLARMSHDMRTPLNAVLGFAAIAQDERDNPQSVLDSTGKIKSSGQYLLGLINDVLDASKLESGKVELHPEVVEGVPFLREIAEEFSEQAKQKGINLVLKLENADTPYVMLDKLRTRQIYSNLLNNALKFSPSGSNVEWSMTDTVLDKGHMKFVSTISDNGVGMSEEFMKHMFEPFTQEIPEGQTLHEGTGLGLMIVKKFVELSGGTIECSSEVGKGTTFTLNMTREIPSREQISEYESKKLSSLPDLSVLCGKRVLLCEDHPLNREIAVKLLSKAGLETESAENGKIGVDLFHSKPNGYFDAVLMDIRMPVMGGIEAARLIRERDGRVPIIAVTANAFPEDVEESLKAGIDIHLSKPLEPSKLYSTLSLLISDNNKR